MTMEEVTGLGERFGKFDYFYNLYSRGNGKVLIKDSICAFFY